MPRNNNKPIKRKLIENKSSDFQQPDTNTENLTSVVSSFPSTASNSNTSLLLPAQREAASSEGIDNTRDRSFVHREEEKKEASAELAPIPEVIQELVLDYLDREVGDQKPEHYSPRQHCRFFEGEFNTRPYDRLAVHVLLQHVVRGEQEQAEAMLNKNPYLLFIKGRVRDYSGRLVEGSAFQLALAAEDYDRNVVKNINKSMLEMMKQFIDQIDPERRIAKEQFVEQFPKLRHEFEEGDEQKVEEFKEASYDFERLVNTLTADPFPNGAVSIEAATMEIEQFRTYLDNLAKGVIKKGRHFNVQILVDVLKVYSQNYCRWSEAQRAVFVENIVGYALRYLPANYAQACCMGFEHALEAEKINRCLTLDDGTLYFPMDSNLHKRLGFHFGIYSYTLYSDCSEHGRCISSYGAQPWLREWIWPGSMEPENLLKLCSMKAASFNQFKEWLKVPALMPVNTPCLG